MWQEDENWQNQMAEWQIWLQHIWEDQHRLLCPRWSSGCLLEQYHSTASLDALTAVRGEVGEVLHGRMLHGEVLHGGVLHGRVLHGGMLHGEVLHGGMLHGEVLHGGLLHGEVLHDGMLHGEVLHGGLLHGKVLHGGVLHDATHLRSVVLREFELGVHVLDPLSHWFIQLILAYKPLFLMIIHQSHHIISPITSPQIIINTHDNLGCIDIRNIRTWPDGLVHDWLGEGGFIEFIVAIFAVANVVDDDVFLE